MTTKKYALSHSERGWLAYIQRSFFKAVKGCEEGSETKKWVDLLSLKLLYGLLFFCVVEWIYVWWADNMLSAMMSSEPLIRSEQFVLSILIHYPQFFLKAIEGGLSVLFILNLLIGAWIELARYLYRRKTLSDSVKEGAPHV